jgi:hypothetical protein
LREVVAGRVKAGGVGEVEDIECVAEVVFVAQGYSFDERDVGALLECLAEDVALAGGEAGFVGIG